MVRVRIVFDQISPYLRAMSGTLYVEKVDTEALSDAPLIELFKCQVNKDVHTTGYSISHENSKGIPKKLFECVQPVVDTMLRSYWKGMVLDKEDFRWIQMKGDDSWACLNQLEKEVGGYVARQIQGGTEPEEVIQSVDSSCHQMPPMPLKK